MPTAADDKGRRLQGALEKAEKIHAETMAKFDELGRKQMKLMESVVSRLSKERAERISDSIKNGSSEDIASR